MDDISIELDLLTGKKFPIPYNIKDAIIVLLIESCTMNYPDQRIKIDKIINILITLLKDKLILYSKKKNIKLICSEPREELKFITKLMKCFISNVKDNFEFSKGYLNIGNLFKRQVKINDAEIYYKKSIESNRNNYEAYVVLGQIYEIKCNFEEALNCYTLPN